jgi:hypothetical protein
MGERSHFSASLFSPFSNQGVCDPDLAWHRPGTFVGLDALTLLRKTYLNLSKAIFRYNYEFTSDGKHN